MIDVFFQLLLFLGVKIFNKLVFLLLGWDQLNYTPILQIGNCLSLFLSQLLLTKYLIDEGFVSLTY